MKEFVWDMGKELWLLEHRSVSFRQVVEKILKDDILAVLPHPIKADQQLFVLTLDAYTYIVPYKETKTEIILKTIYPSHKHHKYFNS